ncbi:MAG: hypothetical protein AAF206_13225 [Bacteroidota bacterium]
MMKEVRAKWKKVEAFGNSYPLMITQLSMKNFLCSCLLVLFPALIFAQRLHRHPESDVPVHWQEMIHSQKEWALYGWGKINNKTIALHEWTDINLTWTIEKEQLLMKNHTLHPEPKKTYYFDFSMHSGEKGRNLIVISQPGNDSIPRIAGINGQVSFYELVFVSREWIILRPKAFCPCYDLKNHTFLIDANCEDNPQAYRRPRKSFKEGLRSLFYRQTLPPQPIVLRAVTQLP